MSILTDNLSLLDQAIILATRAHAGQIDKGGAPYILHTLRVMTGCKTKEQRIAAALHDTYEDGGITIEYIERHYVMVSAKGRARGCGEAERVEKGVVKKK